ncbi:MAG: tetratricopeptide repeat protein, partial [Bacteroidia bacterium]
MVTILIRLVFIIFALLVSPLHAQPDIDSLHQVIDQTANPDTNTVWTHRHLFRAYYRLGQHDNMLQAADEGLQLARKLEFPSGINYMIYYKATALEILGRGKEAMPLFDEGIAVSYQIKDTLGAADYLINKGGGHYNLGNQDEALQSYLKAYEIYGRYGKQQKLSKTLNNIGVIYRTQKKYD